MICKGLVGKVQGVGQLLTSPLGGAPMEQLLRELVVRTVAMLITAIVVRLLGL